MLRLYALLLEHAMSFDADGYKEVAVASRYLGRALDPDIHANPTL